LETEEERGSGTNELKVPVPQTSSHPSWDVLSSEVQYRLNMEGLYLEILLFQNGLRFLSEELSDEGVSVGRYFRVGGDETSCWRTGGWRPGWHCTGWPEWFAGISRGESL